MPKEPLTKAGAMDRIRAAVLDKSRRSSLHRWMVANYDEFAQLLLETGRPEWDVIATALAAEGLKDGDGKSPTKEGARQTWWKVKKERQTGAEPDQQAEAAKPSQSSPHPDSVIQHRSSQNTDESPTIAPPRFQRRPVAMRGANPPKERK